MAVDPAVLKPYQVRAVNDALTSENRIHSDDIARKYGFTGALVSGVSVFGYLAHPLVEVYGGDWLGHTMAEVRFLKPAYADEALTVTSAALDKPGQKRPFLTQVHNPSGTLLAELRSWRPNTLPAINPLARSKPAAENAPRADISWEGIRLNEPAAAYHCQFDRQLHQEKLQLINDTLPLFHVAENAPLHPYVLLKECNLALMRLYILPAWIHVGSNMVWRRVLRENDRIEVRTIPVDKWERKGHQFIKLYIAMLVDGEVAFEVEHTAIFRIAA